MRMRTRDDDSALIIFLEENSYRGHRVHFFFLLGRGDLSLLI